jgi:hypothetical protein
MNQFKNDRVFSRASKGFIYEETRKAGGEFISFNLLVPAFLASS